MAAFAYEAGVRHLPVAASALRLTAVELRRRAAGLRRSRPHRITPAEAAALHRLSYVSRGTAGDEDAGRRDLADIIEVSADRNAAQGITGALAHGAGWFVQVIEGPLGSLMAAFDRILCDLRHADVRVLGLEPATDRRFPSTPMADAGEMPEELIRRAVAARSARQRGGEFAAEALQALMAAMRARLPAAA
jgi:hypothetical protein